MEGAAGEIMIQYTYIYVLFGAKKTTSQQSIDRKIQLHNKYNSKTLYVFFWNPCAGELVGNILLE
jgi:hypothetical protein